MRRPARSSPAATLAADPKGLAEPDQGSASSEAKWTRQDVWREVQPLHVELDRLRTELTEAHGRNNRQESFVWEAAAEANGLRAQLTKLRQNSDALHAELLEATAAADAAPNEGDVARGACDVAAQQERRAEAASIEVQQEAEELRLARSRLAEMENLEVVANRALAAMHADLEVHGVRHERRASEASFEAQQEAEELHLARARLAEIEKSEVTANRELVAVHTELEVHRARELQSLREFEMVQVQEMRWLEHARHAEEVAHREELAADAARAEAHSEAEEARSAATSCQDEVFLVGLARRKAVEEAVAWKLAQAEAATFGSRAKRAAACESMWHEKALRSHAGEVAAASASGVCREEVQSMQHCEAALKATLAVHEAAGRMAEETAEAAAGQAETEQHKAESLSAELVAALQRCRQRTSRSAALPVETELSTSEQRRMLRVATGETVGRRRSSRTLSETPKRRSSPLEDDHVQATGSLSPPLAFSRKTLPPLPRSSCKQTASMPAPDPSKLSPNSMAGLAAYSRLRMSTSSLDPTIGTGMSHTPAHQPMRLSSTKREGQPAFGLQRSSTPPLSLELSVD